MTLVSFSNPSISTKIWFRVCSRSSCEPPKPDPRCRPTASISSIKIIHGELRLAFLNKSRTRDAPTPTNISTNSDPEIWKNGTFASPATARATSVLPTPGGPKSNTPFGMRAPRLKNFWGNRKNSTISFNSSFASLIPATSEKVTRLRRSDCSRSLAPDWPNDMARLFEPWTWRIRNQINPAISRNGMANGKIVEVRNEVEDEESLISIFRAWALAGSTPASFNVVKMETPDSFWLVCWLPSFRNAVSLSPATSKRSIFPVFTSSAIWETETEFVGVVSELNNVKVPAMIKKTAIMTNKLRKNLFIKSF